MGADAASRWQRLGEFIAELRREKGVPGVAVGILYQGEISTAGFGVTSVENPLPVTPETLFQIGSITKTFTTTAILRLVDQGKLALDAPLRKVLPEFRVASEEASAQATLRHLLTHTGGWEGDFFEDTGLGDDALARYLPRMAELEQVAPLGSLFSYNNSGFKLAGRVVELAAGKPYDVALRELVLQPLGLERTFLLPSDVMTHRFVVGHCTGAKGGEVLRPWPVSRASWPAGGLVSTVPDLLRYARFHLGDGRAEDGTPLLVPETLALMHAPQVTVWGKAAWTLGWSVDDSAGLRRVAHGGGTLGQISHLILVPERAFALAILTNADHGGQVTSEAGRWLLKEYLGLDLPQPAPMAASRELLEPYVGRYTSQSEDVDLAILCGRLVAQMMPKVGFPTRDCPTDPPPPMTLGLSEPDRLLALDGPAKGSQLDVIRRPDGSVGWLRTGLRLRRREES